jgi:chemosensory pili system protein ChpA (sensor histidine kinase/response regulator)
VVDLAGILGFEQATLLGRGEQASLIISHAGPEPLGLLVEQILGRQEVVVKSLGPLLSKTPCAAGATQIGDRIALVVDLVSVAERARRRGSRGDAIRVREAVAPRGHVLIVEDSAVIRETIQRELERAGYEVTTAEDGVVALELARAFTFDAVCTDVMMPNMDGYQLTRALRRLPEYKSVPIAMVTSKDARIDSLRGHDAGASVYLTKPTEASLLIRQLDALLRGAKGQK